MFVNTGDYLEQKSNSKTPSTYYTFTPRLLMSGNFYKMDDELASLLSKTHRTLGVLEGLTFLLPDKEALLNLTLFKEAYFSKAIDYPSEEIRSVLVNQALGRASADIRNIASAYQHILESASEKVDFDDIARCAFYGKGSSQKVSIRTQPMFLTNSVSNYRQYNPTAPQDIRSVLADIKNYMELSETDLLIKTAMCHYQFEMTHPYDSYNGIIGRILAYRIIACTGLSGSSYFGLSECLCLHKTAYFDRLAQTQKNGNYTAWIEWFIQIVGESAQNAIESAKRYAVTARLDEEKLASRVDRMRYISDVYNYFKKHVVSNVGLASEELRISFNAVSRAVEVLCNLGILEQLTTHPRNRLFAHKGLAHIVSNEQL